MEGYGVDDTAQTCLTDCGLRSQLCITALPQYVAGNRLDARFVMLVVQSTAETAGQSHRCPSHLGDVRRTEINGIRNHAFRLGKTPRT